MDHMLAGRYQLTVPLGRGGMSTVWVAVDQRLGAQVAIKLLDPLIAENPKALARFLREARTIAQLRSRHVIRVFDCGVDKGTPFIAMELLEGQSLRQLLQQDRVLSPNRTAAILLDVALAMQVAHEQGIVHRDLKPDNVFLAREDNDIVVKVLDFGIAKRPLQQSTSSSGAFTEAGEVFGTPNYMSPEQIDARCAVDHRADIWAMAIMAFECLIGRVPFMEDTLQEQFLAICMRSIPRPSSMATVPSGFDAWFAKGTARIVDERFSDAMQAGLGLNKVCVKIPELALDQEVPLQTSSEAALVSGTKVAGTLRGVTSNLVERTKVVGSEPAFNRNTSTSAPVTSVKTLRTDSKPRRPTSTFLMPVGLVVLVVTSLASYFALKPAGQTLRPDVAVQSVPTDGLAHSSNPVVTTPASASGSDVAAVATQKVQSSQTASSIAINGRPPPSATSRNVNRITPGTGQSRATIVDRGSNPRTPPARPSSTTRRPRVDLGL